MQGSEYFRIRDITPKGDGNFLLIYLNNYRKLRIRDITPKGDGNYSLIVTHSKPCVGIRDITPKGDGNPLYPSNKLSI